MNNYETVLHTGITTKRRRGRMARTDKSRWPSSTPRLTMDTSTWATLNGSLEDFFK